MVPSTKHSFLNILLAFVFFLLSAVITGWFISCGDDLYHFDLRMMILSGLIAGGKWAIQIFAAFIFLPGKRWLFIRHIAFVCFAGSCILIPFCLFTDAFGPYGFIGSLIVAVCLMLALYYYYVHRDGLSVKWYFLWIFCLAVAIGLQLTVVFHVIV